MELDTNTPTSGNWARGRCRTGEAQRGSVGSAWEAKKNLAKEEIFGLGFEAPIGACQAEQ